ncbi:hypothetical protein [Streptomyces sp. NPDC020983]|uniref:hypothetical protein n=1 Tax=Streptomyces sp. NPDC020983 TaxID=3365106 RepID=UPI0037B9DA10
MRIRTVAVALAAAATITLTGCSSGSSSNDDTADEPSGTTAPAATTAAVSDSSDGSLAAAVTAYSDAYFKPDAAAALALLSARCRAQVTAEAYRAELDQATATYGHQRVKAVTVDRLSGDMALVSYTYDVPALDQHGQPWAREHGAWHYDAC